MRIYVTDIQMLLFLQKKCKCIVNFHGHICLTLWEEDIELEDLCLFFTCQLVLFGPIEGERSLVVFLDLPRLQTVVPATSFCQITKLPFLAV